MYAAVIHKEIYNRVFVDEEIRRNYEEVVLHKCHEKEKQKNQGYMAKIQNDIIIKEMLSKMTVKAEQGGQGNVVSGGGTSSNLQKMIKEDIGRRFID